MDLSGEWLKAIFTAATILISYFGYRLSRRGQEASNREQKFTQEFAALKLVNDTLTAENIRQRSDLADVRRERDEFKEQLKRSEDRERAAVDVVHDEWEPRWARQLGRCRAVTSSLVETIVSLQRVAPPKKKAEAQKAIDRLEQHRATDHIEMRPLDEDDALGL